MATPQTVRRFVLTGAVTAITVMGTVYGAQLKTQLETRQEHKRLLQATPEEMIAQLEVARADLVRKKNELERKIASFRTRRNGDVEEKRWGM